MTDSEKSPSAQPPVPPAPKKKLDKKTLLALIVGTLILVMAVSMLNVNDISKGYIEKVASDTLQVPVRIAKLEMNIKERRVVVQGLMVSNPSGFSRPLALGVDSIDITVESGSPEQIVFREINAKGASVILEVLGGRTNLTTLHKNMDRLAAAKTDKAKDKPAKPPVSVVIRSLKVDGAQMMVAQLNGTGFDPMPLPPLHMTGIGEEAGGVLASQAIAEVVEEVTKLAMEQAMAQGWLDTLSAETLRDIKTSLGLDYISRAQDAVDQLGRNLQEYIGRR